MPQEPGRISHLVQMEQSALSGAGGGNFQATNPGEGVGAVGENKE